MDFRISARLVPGVGTLAAFTLLLLPSSAHAQLTYFTTRSSFNTAAPGLPTETLEGGTYTADSNTGALDKFTNNSNFATGSILDGLRLQATGSLSSSGAYFYNNISPFNTGNGTKVWTTNQQGDSLDLTFYNNNVRALGFDLGSSSSSSSANYVIQIFGVGNTLLDTRNVTVNANVFSFFGLTSTAIVTRVNVSQSSWETVDNISFGPIGSAAAAPEPGSIALLISAALPLSGAILSRRRRAITS